MTLVRLNRRSILRVLGGMVASAWLPTWAQQSTKVPIVGVLLVPPPYFVAFAEAMGQLGYTKGKNISYETSKIEQQFFPHHLTTEAEQQYAGKVPEAAADLVRMNVDIIVTGPNPFIDAA